MKQIFFSLMLSFFLLIAGRISFADTFETRAGEIYTGEILEEDTSTFYINTAAGVVINVRKMDLMAVNGKPYQYAGQGSAPVKPLPEGAPLPYLGGVSAEDRALEKLPKPGKNIGVQFETAGGKKNTEVPVKPGQISTVIHPSGITEDQLRAYYASHKEEFRVPAQVRLKYLNPPALEGVSEDILKKILKDTSVTKAWKDAGWVKKGDKFSAPFSTAEQNQILGLRKDQTLRINSKEAYFFWATDRQESAILPYVQARPKVLNRILQINSKTLKK